MFPKKFIVSCCQILVVNKIFIIVVWNKTKLYTIYKWILDKYEDDNFVTMPWKSVWGWFFKKLCFWFFKHIVCLSFSSLVRSCCESPSSNVSEALLLLAFVRIIKDAVYVTVNITAKSWWHTEANFVYVAKCFSRIVYNYFRTEFGYINFHYAKFWANSNIYQNCSLCLNLEF